MSRAILFGAAFLLAAIVASTDVWGRDRSYYDEVARDVVVKSELHVAGEAVRVDAATIAALDDETRRYVLGETGAPGALERRYFDANELSHLSDVRSVIAVVRVAGIAGAVAAVLLALGIPRPLLRRALFVDAALAIAVGVVAAVSFDFLWLAIFHPLLFPEGNYLFDPARQNLVVVYPDEYWQGVALRYLLTLTLICLVVGALVGLPIRSASGARSTRERVG